jgi:arsenic resistance protein ArsH
MKPSSHCDRLVNVMEELVKFTLLVRDRSDYLVDRYSERKEDPHKQATVLAAIAKGQVTARGARAPIKTYRWLNRTYRKQPPFRPTC